MVKVKASLEMEELPKNIIVEIPKEYCNRRKFMERIKEVLYEYVMDNSKVKYEVLDE